MPDRDRILQILPPTAGERYNSTLMKTVNV
jgi:hypothetical protein